MPIVMMFISAQPIILIDPVITIILMFALTLWITAFRNRHPIVLMLRS